MQFDKNRRTLLKAAVALGLAISIPVSKIVHAGARAFLKIEGVDGEAKDDAHNEWIAVDAIGRRNKLILRSKNGEKRIAKQGTYRLSDGSVISVKNGIIVRRSGARRQSPAVKR